jgi:RNA polymerase sigma-70 factor (ECF subfamily)
VDAHYTPLHRFALRLTRNSADAADLVQQTFFIWATKGAALREAAKAKSWLHTTLYREFVGRHRRNSRLVSLHELSANHTEIASPVIDRIARLDSAIVLLALQRVDEVFRTPLKLFYLDELSYRQIADALNVPMGTVTSRISRGKDRLRVALGVTDIPSR